MICIVEILIQRDAVQNVEVKGPFDSEQAAKDFYFGEGKIIEHYQGLDTPLMISSKMIVFTEMDHPHEEISDQEIPVAAPYTPTYENPF